jgi:hypothetical protein
MLIVVAVNAQDDYTVTCSSPSIGNGYIKPMKAGSSLQFQINMKNNTTVTYTASINKNAMPYGEWVQIDNNSQTLAPNQTITFLLTLTVPAGTSDLYTYPFPFYFNAYDSNNNNNPYLWTTLQLIVDNTPPVTPSVLFSSKTSTSVSVTWSSQDERSSTYTLANSSSGEQGIKSYTVTLKNSDGTITIGTPQSYSAPNPFPYATTFPGLTGYTDYKVYVTATDLAGNPSTNTGLSVRTPPAPPTSCTFSSTYCQITLTWSSAIGAVGYYICDGSHNRITPNPVVSPYTITNRSLGTNYSFSLVSVSSTGETSDFSSIFTTATLPMPTPAMVTTDLNMCSNDKTLEISAVPFSDSYTWTVTSPLSINGLQTITTTNTSVGLHTNLVQGISTVTVVANLTCGFQSNTLTKSVQMGIPTPSITATKISATGEPTMYRFTASASGYTGLTYNWYVNSVLQQSSADNTLDWYFPCRVTKTINCKVVSSCGTSPVSNSITKTGECSRLLSFKISPNPTSDNVLVSSQSTESTNSFNSDLVSTISFDFVRIFDFQGSLKRIIKYSEANSVIINVSDLKDGMYIFEIGNDDYTEKHQVIIKK